MTSGSDERLLRRRLFELHLLELTQQEVLIGRGRARQRVTVSLEDLSLLLKPMMQQLLLQGFLTRKLT